jgi:CubicO group peptidase (beta-lactamase class C family)
MDVLQLITRLPVPALHRCRVPYRLDDVTHLGEEVPAREVGLEQAVVERIWDAIGLVYRTGLHPAIQVCIRHRGAVVLHRAVGHASGNEPGASPDDPKVLATTATPFCLFSAAKAVTAMVIHKLDERGQLHLEDRVCDYIPDFARHGKDGITIRHVLCHRAGIPNLPPEAMDLALLEDPARVVEILCDQKPRTRPGRLLAYHAVSGGFVLGEVVRAITGQDIRHVLAKEILEPMGLRWMNYGVDPADVDKVAVNAVTGLPMPPPISVILERALGTSLENAIALSNDRRFITGIIPAANVMTTAYELSAFYQCLLDGGEYEGVRAFEPRTVRHATGEQSYWEVDLTLGAPIRYGLGFMLGGVPGLFGPDAPEAFGHVGLSNITGYADPERDLAVGIVNSGKPVISAHVARVINVLREIGRGIPKVAPRDA